MPATSPAPRKTTSAPKPAIKPLTLTSSGLLAGTARPVLPTGVIGKLSVIKIGPLTNNGEAGSELPVIYRNNTSKAVAHVDITGVARVGAKIVTTGQSQGAEPAQVPPGGAGVAFIFFEKVAPPKMAKYSFTFETSPADSSPFNTAPLTVTQANNAGGSIVGSAKNATGHKISGPYSVDVYCFSKANELLSGQGGFTDQDQDQAPGATLTFSLDPYGSSCPRFVVGSSGYFGQ